MGLDMYLHRKTYVKNWDWMDSKDLHQVDVKLDDKEHPYIDLTKVSTIEEEVGYWRKANAIHQWFVNNVQEGVDDCKEYYVGYEELKELLNLCKQVLEHRPKENDEEIDDITPENLLPTQQGFFFGNTEYDDNYYNDIEDTIKILEPIVELNNKIINDKSKMRDIPSYWYQSSW